VRSTSSRKYWTNSFWEENALSPNNILYQVNWVTVYRMICVDVLSMKKKNETDIDCNPYLNSPFCQCLSLNLSPINVNLNLTALNDTLHEAYNSNSKTVMYGAQIIVFLFYHQTAYCFSCPCYISRRGESLAFEKWKENEWEACVSVRPFVRPFQPPHRKLLLLIQKRNEFFFAPH
jgi:hypothetical protein